MRRTIGYLFFYGGILVIVLGWVFHNRPAIYVADHMLAPWVIGAVAGVVLVLLGVIISGPTRKR